LHLLWVRNESKVEKIKEKSIEIICKCKRNKEKLSNAFLIIANQPTISHLTHSFRTFRFLYTYQINVGHLAWLGLGLD